jgi:hypothetical protein
MVEPLAQAAWVVRLEPMALVEAVAPLESVAWVVKVALLEAAAPVARLEPAAWAATAVAAALQYCVRITCVHAAKRASALRLRQVATIRIRLTAADLRP